MTAFSTIAALASAISISDGIGSMASRLADLHAADDATVWEAIASLFPEVYGTPCNRTNSYHIALASAVARVVKGLE